MVTKPFKIGPFGMPLRRFFFFVFVQTELVPGAKDQDSAVFLIFFDAIFSMFFFMFSTKISLGSTPTGPK